MCGCAGTNKDQTGKKVFEYLEEQATNRELISIKGIGMFVVPDPENGILERKVVRVGDLDYFETKKRGENCFSFKWIPYGFSFEQNGQTVTVAQGDERKPWVCIPNRCSSITSSDCTAGCACDGRHCG